MTVITTAVRPLSLHRGSEVLTLTLADDVACKPTKTATYAAPAALSHCCTLNSAAEQNKESLPPHSREMSICQYSTNQVRGRMGQGADGRSPVADKGRRRMRTENIRLRPCRPRDSRSGVVGPSSNNPDMNDGLRLRRCSTPFAGLYLQEDNAGIDEHGKRIS